GKKPGDRSKNPEKDFERYDKKRFIIMTGKHLEETPTQINEAQNVIDYLYEIYFPEQEERKRVVNAELLSPNMPDDEVIKIASNAKNGDKFKALYSGDISSYGSHSEADQALCNLIAPYTPDLKQIDRT